jgi:hypothetical protein
LTTVGEQLLFKILLNLLVLRTTIQFMKNSNLIMQYTGRTWSDPQGKTFHIYLITGGPVDQYKSWRDSNSWKTSVDTVTGFITVFYPAFVGNRAELYKNKEGGFSLSVLAQKRFQYEAESLYTTYNKVGEELKQVFEDRKSYVQSESKKLWYNFPTFDYSKYKEVEQVEESSDESEGLAEG